MTIQSIRLRNFRGFRDVTLSLKPLTVLLGPNSSGKSSFGHALAATAHCQKRDPGGQRPTLSPTGNPDEWPIDLGTTSDLRMHGQSGRIFISFQLSNDWVDLGFGDLQPNPNNLTLSYVSHPFSPLGVVETKPPIIEGHGPESRSEVIGVKLSKVPEPISNISIALRRDTESIWWDENTSQQASVDLDGLLVRSMKHVGGTAFAPRKETRDAISSLFEKLTYLRASRRRPSRYYPDQLGAEQPIGYAGEWTATLLREQGPRSTSFPVPTEIPNNDEEIQRAIDGQWQNWQGSLLAGVGLWLTQLRLALSVESIKTTDARHLQLRVTLPGQKPRDITEVGFGISQVLPILTAGLMQQKDSLLIVDLPEAHLHPLAQARIADFFCSLALADRNALIETHSEVFFHWLRLRAELNESLSDKIAVYFIDRPGEDGCCSQPQPVGLTGESQLRWPVGFFEEAWDIETRIRGVRAARGRRRK